MTEPFPRGPRFLGITPGFAAGLYGTAVLAVAGLAFGRYLEGDRFALLAAFALGLPLLPPLLRLPPTPRRLVILQVLGVVLGLIAALGLIALPGKIAGYGGTFDTTEGVEGAYILALVLVLGPAVPLVIPAFRRASPLWQAAVRRVTRFGGLALAFAAAFPAVMSIAMGFIYWQVLGAWVIVGLGVLVYWPARPAAAA